MSDTKGGERVKTIAAIMIVLGLGLLLLGGFAACSGDKVKCGAAEMAPSDVCMSNGLAETYEEQRDYQNGLSYLGIAGGVLFGGGVIVRVAGAVVRRKP